MKKLILIAMAMVFVVTSASAAALACACPEEAMGKVSQHMAVKADMPCHKVMPDTKKENPHKSDHCKGQCLCLHSAASKTLVFTIQKPEAPLYEPHQDNIFPSQTQLLSHQKAPPLRPPITLS